MCPVPIPRDGRPRQRECVSTCEDLGSRSFARSFRLVGFLTSRPGGREAARDAEAALHAETLRSEGRGSWFHRFTELAKDWEIAEQQRQESRMALQHDPKKPPNSRTVQSSINEEKWKLRSGVQVCSASRGSRSSSGLRRSAVGASDGRTSPLCRWH